MTDKYALIGNPISHSKSPLIHSTFAAETGQDLSYTLVEAQEGGFRAAVDAFRRAGGRGMNVTAPFKVQAFDHADECSERARQAGSVNALRFHGERVPVEVPGAALACELACGKGLTPFLRLAAGAGVKRLADGVGMLVEQAAEAFLWWRGVRPDTRQMIERLGVPLV